MSPRGAVAGAALAAAGMLYSRLAGRRDEQRAPALDPEPEQAPDAAVERARTELADELARRASAS